MGHVTINMPFSEMVCQPTGQFDVSTFTHYEDMKSNEKMQNWDGLGS